MEDKATKEKKPLIKVVTDKGKRKLKEPPEETVILLQVGVWGAEDAGKTALIFRACDDTYIDTKSSSPCDFKAKIFERETHTVKLKIFEFSRSSKSMYNYRPEYINTQVHLILFDITSKASFNTAKQYLEERQSAISDTANKISFLVATKTDQKAVILEEEIEILANEYNLRGYALTSAKTGENVDELFQTVVDQIIEIKEAPAQKFQNFLKNLMNTEAFAGLAWRSILSTNKDKREAIKILLKEIKNAKSIEALEEIFNQDHSAVARNTGTGAYYYFVGCFLGGAESTSDKHLMRLQQHFADLSIDYKKDEQICQSKVEMSPL